jgi:aminoglycoside phosphotransferase family enzyme
VAALRDPACYPEATQGVQAIETHMSWVFLTDAHAYKLKKPVHFADRDFRSADARRHSCEEEVRLNRRLAAPVYLGVVPLAVAGDGGLRVGGQGPAVDWLVRMHRLPAGLMLDSLLAGGAATPAQRDRARWPGAGSPRRKA